MIRIEANPRRNRRGFTPGFADVLRGSSSLTVAVLPQYVRPSRPVVAHPLTSPDFVGLRARLDTVDGRWGFSFFFGGASRHAGSSRNRKFVRAGLLSGALTDGLGSSLGARALTFSLGMLFAVKALAERLTQILTDLGHKAMHRCLGDAMTGDRVNSFAEHAQRRLVLSGEIQLGFGGG